MSKPKKYGMKTNYVPNAKADMRHHKKIYQRGREKATFVHEDQKTEQSKEATAWKRSICL